MKKDDEDRRPSHGPRVRPKAYLPGQAAPYPPQPAPKQEQAKVRNMSTGNFIVVFKKGVTQDQITEYIDQVNESGGEVTHRFDPEVLNGFSAKLTPQSLQSFQSLTGDVIDFIEADGDAAPAIGVASASG